MQLNRVVITGMGSISPYGAGVDCLFEALLAGESAVRPAPDLGEIGGLRARVAARVPDVDGRSIPRKFRRAMSPMSIYAVLAAYEALEKAGLPLAVCTGGDLGICVGTTINSVGTSEDFFADFLTDHSLERMKSGLFFKLMNHSVASNMAQTLGVTGRIMAPAAACATGAQAVGFGYETVSLGRQTRMLCGGAEEFHPLTSATFDVMHAASIGFNDQPTKTPRPFDAERDGMVCGEGAGILLLEELNAAQERGATILGEVVGFSTCSDPGSIANPSASVMANCMRAAVADAGLKPEDIGYVNAHATATEAGDVAEAQAIAEVFGSKVPVSSLKGHLGHTLAASGGLELIASLQMMQKQVLIPSLNLEEVAADCKGPCLLQRKEKCTVDSLVKNNFALGGVNSSIVVRRFNND